MGLDSQRKMLRQFLNNLIQSDPALKAYLVSGYRDTRWAESEPTISVLIPECTHEVHSENPREYKTKAAVLLEILISSEEVTEDYQGISQLLDSMQDKLDDLSALVRERIESGTSDDYETSVWDIVRRLEPVSTRMEIDTRPEQSIYTGIARLLYEFEYYSNAFEAPEHPDVSAINIEVQGVNG